MKEEKKMDVSLFCLTSLPRELKEKYFKVEPKVSYVFLRLQEKKEEIPLCNPVPRKEKKIKGRKDE